MVEIKRVLNIASKITGSEELGRDWYYSYNHHLKGIPHQLAQTKEGLKEVERYLYSMYARLGGDSSDMAL